jgi:flavin reductase (DIM6/NTAB) family NADH-FMN oxidoreductase RutF
MDAHDYPNALGVYPKGVTIVTTYDSADEQWRLGTISFTSVYLDPTFLLVCIAKLGRVFSNLSTLVHFLEPPLVFSRGRFFSAPQTETMA